MCTAALWVGGGKAEKAAITISDWVADSRADSRVEKAAEQRQQSRALPLQHFPRPQPLPAESKPDVPLNGFPPFTTVQKKNPLI